MQFFSQAHQDRYVFENYFRGKRGGVFVDIGAYDGQKFSNSLFFERFMAWTGVCIEPLPRAFEQLQATRTARCVNCCVADYEGEDEFLDVDAGIDEKMLSGLVRNYDPRHVERIGRVGTARNIIRVKVRLLANILAEHDISHVDYLSLDTEGSELAVLRSIDFAKVSIDILSVENNYADPEIRRLLEAQGYVLAHAFERFDELYVHRRVKPWPKTTVICAVWSGDPDRHRLLAGHAATLDRQSVPVERVYVFDSDDKPPADAAGTVLTTTDAVSIYQAWNLALAAIRTPYVMNLNLDDRLAPDAVALLQGEIERQQADLIGGDWRICYDQASTDATEPSYPIDRLPYVADWPPQPGSTTRLGSGGGERGTFGPSSMWRTVLHMRLARYPWQFSDGSLIRVIGDSIWWRFLAREGCKRVRLPAIIGHYHSHPGGQAEFRNDAAAEEEIFRTIGIAVP